LTSWAGSQSTPSLLKREPPEPVLAAHDEKTPKKTPVAPYEPAGQPEAVAKQQPKPAEPKLAAPDLAIPQLGEPPLLPGFNTLPDLPLGPMPTERSPLAGPPPSHGQEKPGAVTAAPLPENAPGVVPPMPRLPGASAPAAVQTAPERAEAVANELHS